MRWIIIVLIILLCSVNASADFVDNFDGSAINTTLWTETPEGGGGVITVSGGEAHFNPNNDTGSVNLRTNGTYTSLEAAYVGIDVPSGYGYASISIANNGTGTTPLVGVGGGTNWWLTYFKNGYTVEIGTTNIKLYVIQNGANVQIGSTYNSIPDVYRNYTLFVNSTGVHVNLNGTTIITSSNSTYTSGGDVLLSQGSWSGGNFREGNYSYAKGILNAPLASAPIIISYAPGTPNSTYENVAATYNATINQSNANNEWHINGTRYEWDNATGSPQYSNSTWTNGTYNLTLISHNNSDYSLTDSQTWIVTVLLSYEPTIPTITNLTNSTPTRSTVNISWNTNISSNNLVCYGTNETTVNDWSGCTNSTWDNSTTSISISLSGLTENTTYYYKPWSAYALNTSFVNSTVAAKNFTTSPTTYATKNFITLPIYLMFIIVLVGCFIGTMKGNSIVGMISGVLSVMISYFLAKVSINDQLIETYGMVGSTDTIVTGTNTIHISAMFYILMFIALISAILLIYHIFNEINNQLTPELEDEFYG